MAFNVQCQIENQKAAVEEEYQAERRQVQERAERAERASQDPPSTRLPIRPGATNNTVIFDGANESDAAEAAAGYILAQTNVGKAGQKRRTQYARAMVTAAEQKKNRRYSKQSVQECPHAAE